MTIFWVHPSTGAVIRATSDDGDPPTPNAVAVNDPPESGNQKRNFNTLSWSPLPPAELPEADLGDLWGLLESKNIISPTDIPPGRRKPRKRA